jgi:hypothetical protein
VGSFPHILVIMGRIRRFADTRVAAHFLHERRVSCREFGAKNPHQ